MSGAETFLVAVGTVTSYTDDDDDLRHDLLLQGRRRQRDRRGRALERALRDTHPDGRHGTVEPGQRQGARRRHEPGRPELDGLDRQRRTSTGYQVYRDGALVGTTPDPHYLDGGMAAGTTHSYQVRAIDAAGNASPASSTLSARLASVSGTTGTLSGVVYSSAGKLLTNVVVSYRLANGTVKSAKTNMSGIWKLSSLPLGPYTLTAEMSGYRSQTFDMTAASGQTLLAITTLS